MRLNKEIRESIIEKAMEESTITKAVEFVRNDEYKLAEFLRVHFLGCVEETIRIQSVADKIDELYIELPVDLRAGSAYSKVSHIRIGIGSEYEKLEFESPAIFNSKTNYVGIGTELAKTIQEFLSKKRKVKEARNRAETLLTNLVYTATTTAGLLKVWPEGKKFIPSDSEFQSFAVAVKTDELNYLLGL